MKNAVELRVNLLFLAVVAVAALGLSATGPVSALDPHAVSTRALRDLEDRFARAPADHDLALSLVEAYLERDRPELAITALRAADRRVVRAPDLQHRLSQAFEAVGRVEEALAVADVARSRCADAFDVEPASEEGAVCTPQQLAVYDVHRTALRHLREWGVEDPRHDERTQLAYDLAMRRARVVLAP